MTLSLARMQSTQSQTMSSHPYPSMVSIVGRGHAARRVASSFAHWSRKSGSSDAYRRAPRDAFHALKYAWYAFASTKAFSSSYGNVA